MAQMEKLSPHFQIPDVVMCLDKNNQAQPITPFFSTIADKFIKYVPENYKHLKLIAFVYGTHHHHIFNTTKPMGPLVKKVRQLKLLGYQPVVVSIPTHFFMDNFFLNHLFALQIPYYEWQGLEFKSQQMEYLKKIIDNKL